MSGAEAGRRSGAPEHPLWRRLVVGDCVAAPLFTAFFVVLSVAQHGGWPGPGGLALLAAMGLPLAVRRLWPGPVALAVTLASGTAAALGVVSEPLLAVAFALYSAAVSARWSSRAATRTVAAVCGAALLTMVVAGPPEGFEDGVPAWLTGAIVAALAWASGQAVRQRRAYAARAAQQLATVAVAQERLRIARELHDVVAHHVGVIAVKASVAHHVAATRPEEAVEALRVIDSESHTALREMRDMLGLLRAGAHAGTSAGEHAANAKNPENAEDADGAADTAAGGSEGEGEGTRHPGRRLSEPADVSELVERARGAGVALTLDTDGLRGLPDGLSRSAYRVVQEALTNVMKHAAPCDCRVTLLTGGGTLRIDVSDDGRATRARAPGSGHPTVGSRSRTAGNGHGVIGMRERVELYGGELSVGPRPNGGFAVRARIPLPAAPHPPPAPDPPPAPGTGRTPAPDPTAAPDSGSVPDSGPAPGPHSAPHTTGTRTGTGTATEGAARAT
ncbi:sensor histidine kinase [Streptomyces iconiensis]|uniref:histidine kinase n=1 Tax=Streptomyces iconiensis TaxID=1384038 RepID=A0ABT7A044_9ACTN|nr:histidine kinase [Streptomyces iconiensis]MDJ1134695.1 histidine kinase [Streptomyces iconiensis]